MKPVYLEFCGVNSFSEKASIDFKKLTEFGLFGIFGDTGSGKSTVLDCISFALYGAVSRARAGSLADVINSDSDRASVSFEFEIVYEGRRRTFRAERELRRKNAAQFAKLYEREEGSLLAFADGVRECNEKIERIIGLEQKDFEKCIALPQGEFAQFVKAQRADRLKLISRLFGLEEFGEKLVKKANALCAKNLSARELLEKRLEDFQKIDSASLLALEEEIKELCKLQEKDREALALLREEEKKTLDKLKRKEEAQENARTLERLLGQKAEIDRLETQLGRILLAQRAKAACAEAEEKSEQRAAAQRALEAAEAALSRSKKQEEALSAFNAEEAEEEIGALLEKLRLAERAEEAEKNAAALKKKLEAARLAYFEEAEKFKDFRYDEEKKEIEERLSALGGGDFLEFLKDEGAAVFSSEYLAFSAELKEIYLKYPETEGDVRPLAEKYENLSKKQGPRFLELKQKFEARERERKKAQEELLFLEKKNGLYRTHKERLLQLQTEGGRIKEELALLPDLSESGEKSESIKKRIEEKKRQKREMGERREAARADVSKDFAALSAAMEKARAAAENEENAAKRAHEALLEGEFSSKEEAETLLKSFEGQNAKERIASFRAEFAAASAKAKEFENEDFSADLKGMLQSVKSDLSALETRFEEEVRTLARKQGERERQAEALGKKRALEKEYSVALKKAEISERLKKLLEGNKFMEFAAEEYLVGVAQNGSARLLQLTGGRYFLRYDKGFFVGDNLGGGKLRGVYTLSGGEIFLVSLSLALALSAEICAKSLRPIEFFFLDEGFGTLDGQLVDVVMDSLEKLKGEHFSIGVISHVEELKHRIAKKLLVEKANEEHGSRIKAE